MATGDSLEGDQYLPKFLITSTLKMFVKSNVLNLFNNFVKLN